jgi:transcriptional regulator with XRE-family HTH domain
LPSGSFVADRQRHAEAVDAHVGSRIRLRRAELKISQLELSERLGIAFQQVQKYEVGRNRVSASRLVDIARALEVKPSYFFRGLASGAERKAAEPTNAAALQRIVNDKSMLRLLRTISRIKDARVRVRTATVVRMIAG